MTMKETAIIAALATAAAMGSPAWAQFTGNATLQNIIMNMGATTSGMLNPPGSMYYPDIDLDPDNDVPAGPVIEIEGEGVNKIPPTIGPVRSTDIRGEVLPSGK